ncbi:hypothetical protein BDP27DRAFT_1366932 [Rhodocollybia butyracea]|uniref:Uncharacterized protein n=1 Tax=Rhodocollybia butyracea TaxID=206335 RepID=A0A9P5PFR0_9AGAR|nr:hypothetical protein BDP27DRAFT_1366932 [Rhodocollybia butyracea]
MQPKVFCLYLFAMLVFTSTGGALPVNVHRKPAVLPLPKLRSKPATLPPKHALPQPVLSLPVGSSPFRVRFLDSEGRLRPNSEGPKGTCDTLTSSARTRVGRAFRTLSKNAKGKPAAALHSRFLAGIDWWEDHTRVGAEPVLYVVIKGPPVCIPYCFGLTVRQEELYMPFSVGSKASPTYSELHYPDNSAEGFGMFASRDSYVGHPAIKNALGTFSVFLRGFKKEVMQAQALAKATNNPVIWPVLEATNNPVIWPVLEATDNPAVWPILEAVSAPASPSLDAHITHKKSELQELSLADYIGSNITYGEFEPTVAVPAPSLDNSHLPQGPTDADLSLLLKSHLYGTDGSSTSDHH